MTPEMGPPLTNNLTEDQHGGSENDPIFGPQNEFNFLPKTTFLLELWLAVQKACCKLQ